MTADAYAVLGVAPDASQEAIDAAYRARLLFLHPDRVVGRSQRERDTAGAMLADLQTAWALVGDERARARYDAERDAERAPAPPVHEPPPTPTPAPAPEPEWVVVDEPAPESDWAEPEPPRQEWVPQSQPAGARRRARAGWPWALRVVTWPVRAGWREAGAMAAVLEAGEAPVFFWWPAGAVVLGVVGFVALLVAAKISNAAQVVALGAGGSAQLWWWMVGTRAVGIKINRAMSRRRCKR
jgi:hypothetical protein